jgi:hypothetical protein
MTPACCAGTSATTTMTTIDSVVRSVVIAMAYAALGAPAAAFEIGGVVSWDTLGKVQLVREKDRYVPRYADAVLKLDAKEVKLQGFMMPVVLKGRLEVLKNEPTGLFYRLADAAPAK